MEGLLTCGFVGVMALGLLLLALVLKQGSSLRTLQTAVQKLAQRLATLESLNAQTSVAPQAPPAAAPRPVVVTPPPLPAAALSAAPSPSPSAPMPATKPARAAIDWEAFMGVKLFAWLGGFVLFLGVVFLVKYSFENNLITPVMRIVLGAVIGLALIAGGWFTAVRNYRAPGQSLCATGVLVLYADIFAAHAFYNLIALPFTFALMSAITLAAFLLAVILDAQVVGALGLVGGYLTPPLLSNAPDNPMFLFGYVALLNFGIAAVVLRKKWDYLLMLAAIGTVVTEIAWVPIGNANARLASLGFFIFLGLQAQFLAVAILRQRQTPAEKWSTPAALATGFASLGFGFWLMSYPALANRPGFFFGFNFLADLGLLALALRRPNPARIAAAAGAVVFVILSVWTT